MDKGSQYDPTDARAQGPLKVEAPLTTTSSYNIKGMPTPPAGYGKQSAPGPMPAGMC